MMRSTLRRLARFTFVLVPFVIAACAARGQAKVGAAQPSPAEEPPPAFESSAAATPSASPMSSASPAPTTTASAAPSGEPVQPMPGCSLVCKAAHRGTVAPADEARLTQGLAEVTRELRQCMAGRMPSMTLRFDSTGAITHFGADEEHGESVCVDAANRHLPAVTYPGPVTLRCVERCKR